MKETILAAALGIVASVAPAYGQGSIFFNNYGTTTDAIVTWCVEPVGFLPVDGRFTAGLAYSFGGGPLTFLASSPTRFNPATPGYFQGPIVTIPGYAGGPITFQVLAYDGPTYNSSLRYGGSALFTLPSIATGTQPVGDFGPAFKPFSVGYFECVPEPGTVALVGLGLVSLLIFRSKNRKTTKD